MVLIVPCDDSGGDGCALVVTEMIIWAGGVTWGMLCGMVAAMGRICHDNGPGIMIIASPFLEARSFCIE